MKALEIHLKSGGVVTVDATNVKTRRDQSGEGFTSIEWDTPTKPKRKLHSINPQDISAVVVLL